MMAEVTESKKDLAVLSRTRLVQSAFEALSKNDSQNAQMLFGAAIRKAKRVKLWDVEAEYYKFVTLYLDGDYNESVKRCVECLDGVKMMTDIARAEGIALPQTAVVLRLEQCLIRAMIMRRDSFLQIAKHFWQLSLGEYYLLKRGQPLMEAFFQAWKVFNRQEVSVAYDLMKNELSMYSNFLQTKIDQAKDMVDESEAGSVSDESVAPDREVREIDPDTRDTQFLTGAVSRGLMKLDSEEIDRVIDVLGRSESEKDVALIAELINALGPRSKRPYFLALKTNPLFAEKRRLKEPRAIQFFQEALAFHASQAEEEE